MTETHTITAPDGIKLHVREWGPATGKPILLIHGWSQNYLCWEKQFSSTLADRFRIVALDIRGHGMSDSPLEQSHYTDSNKWADDVASIIETLSLDRPILVGWSYGGLIIGDYVRVHGTGKIAGINFVGAAPALNEASMGKFIGPGFTDNFAAATNPDLAISLVAIRDFLHGCFEIPLSRDEFEVALAFNAVVDPTVRGNLAARDVNNEALFETIDVPVLVTHGDKDDVVLPAAGECFASKCPDATASWYEGVGHAPFLEDAERFNRELGEFRDRVN